MIIFDAYILVRSHRMLWTTLLIIMNRIPSNTKERFLETIAS